MSVCNHLHDFSILFLTNNVHPVRQTEGLLVLEKSLNDLRKEDA